MDEKLWFDPDYVQQVRGEKRMYRRDISRLCWSLLIMLLVGNGVALMIGVLLAVIPEMLGKSITSMNSLLKFWNITEYIYNFLLGYLPSLMGEGVLIILLHCWCKYRLKTEGEAPFPTDSVWKMAGLSVLGGWGAAAIASILLSLFMVFLNLMGIYMGGPNITVPMPDNDLTGFIMSMGYVGIVGPAMEEIIFRGYILNGMKKYGETTAVVISAVMFTLFHGNLTQLVTPMLVGIIFGLLTVRTGSLWPAIICHMLHNIVATALGCIPQPGYVTAFWIYMLVGIAGLVIWWKRYGVEFCILKKGGNLHQEDKIRQFLLAPGFIVFAVVYLWMCSMYFFAI